MQKQPEQCCLAGTEVEEIRTIIKEREHSKWLTAKVTVAGKWVLVAPPMVLAAYTAAAQLLKLLG